MSISRLLFRLAPLCAAALALSSSPGAAQLPPIQSPTGELVARTELRVCADPNNMPFSDEKGEGFENKIAEVLGKDLSLPVKYTWFPQVVGFVRNTLRANRCDLVMGTVAGDEIMQTTTPYYYTSYVVAYRSDAGWSFTDFNDPKLKAMHIGIVAGTPPADLLVRHDLMAHARPYALQVDTRFESPVHQMLTDIVNKEIDAGLLWGPIAGYYIKKGGMPLKLVLLQNEPGAPRMAYHIAMGVRNNEPEWRRRINAAINGHRDDITAILRDYGVPLLDEQGHQAQ